MNDADSDWRAEIVVIDGGECSVAFKSAEDVRIEQFSQVGSEWMKICSNGRASLTLDQVGQSICDADYVILDHALESGMMELFTSRLQETSSVAVIGDPLRDSAAAFDRLGSNVISIAQLGPVRRTRADHCWSVFWAIVWVNR